MLLKTNTIKKISLLLSFIIIYLSKYAYSQEIHFSSLEYDYGTIKEEEGPKKGSFTFTNTGDDTLKILTVKPSCGCTASDYTKDPIPPGGQGFINAIYNPTGRPGKFSKAISVVSNSKTQPNITLIIKGEVIPRPKSKADLYPFSIGNLKLTKTNISFNDIKNTQSKTDTIKVYNISKNSISIVFPSLPSFLKVEAQPVLLEPSQEGLIIVTYDASKRNDWGFLLDQFTIKTNDEVEPLKYITLNANITEDFSTLSNKQLQKKPIISFDTTNFNFGTVKAGEKIQGSFIIQNKGKNKLIIRKIIPNCDCITYNISNTVLKKNAKSIINFTYDTQGKPSRQHKTLAIINNDPKNPIVVLHIQGTTE